MADMDELPVTGHQNANPLPRTAYFYPNAFFLRRLIEATVVAILIISAVLVILWLAIPFRNPEFAVTSLKLTGFNVSDARVTGEWDVRFQVYNRNQKLKLAYGELRSSVFYKNELISRTSVAPFSQGSGKLTVLEARYSAVEASVGGMAADVAARGLVRVDIKLSTVVGPWVGLFKARGRVLRAECKEVPVSISVDGGITGGHLPCLART